MSLWEFKKAYAYLRNLLNTFTKTDHKIRIMIDMRIRFHIISHDSIVFWEIISEGVLLVVLCCTIGAQWLPDWSAQMSLMEISPFSIHPFRVSFIVKALLLNFAKHSSLLFHRASFVRFEMLLIWEIHPDSNWSWSFWIQYCCVMLIYTKFYNKYHI